MQFDGVVIVEAAIALGRSGSGGWKVSGTGKFAGGVESSERDSVSLGIVPKSEKNDSSPWNCKGYSKWSKYPISSFASFEAKGLAPCPACIPRSIGVILAGPSTGRK